MRDAQQKERIQMYDEFEVSKNVSEVFKKGENLVD